MLIHRNNNLISKDTKMIIRKVNSERKAENLAFKLIEKNIYFEMGHSGNITTFEIYPKIKLDSMVDVKWSRKK